MRSDVFSGKDGRKKNRKQRLRDLNQKGDEGNDMDAFTDTGVGISSKKKVFAVIFHRPIFTLNESFKLWTVTNFVKNVSLFYLWKQSGPEKITPIASTKRQYYVLICVSTVKSMTLKPWNLGYYRNGMKRRTQDKVFLLVATLCDIFV